MGRTISSVTGSNAAALAQVDAWRDWPFGKLVLVGPEGAGKTHLAHVWAARAGARIVAAADLDEALIAEDAGALAVEDADRVAGGP
jgi:AAA+ superfamily predicted ATPase